MKNKIDYSNLPSQPGVYILKKDEKILYIGKAKNIKNRIAQYMRGSVNSYKTSKLIQKINSIETIICNNEKESLLLEQELIKKNKPKYNILLLDDKKYPYIVIELKKNKLEIKTKFFYKKQKNTFYYGPLPPSYGYKTIKNFLISECLYENGLPIITKDPNVWKDKFEHAKKILSSSNDEIIKRLKNQMMIASKNEQYELAKEYRDIIQNFNNKEQEQSIFFEQNKDFDVIAFKQVENYLIVNINNFRSGKFFMFEDFIFEINIDIYETSRSFLNNFYSFRNNPNFIVTNLDISPDDIILNSKIVVPKKGNYLKALNNTLKNIEKNKEQKILEIKVKSNSYEKINNFFSEIISSSISDFIMIDNSNESNKNVVSVVIYYKNLMPNYSNYRKYKHPELTIKRKSDVEYLKKCLIKYFEGNKNEIPDLIIVDGGIQQINEAKKTIKKLKISIPIIGLVKNKQHKTDYLMTSFGKKIKLLDKQIYNFFAKIQDEVDKFAKNYHTKTKINSSLDGFLSSIDGIGSKTEKNLLDHFKTYSNIYNATYESLVEIVSPTIAKKIIKKLGK